MAEDCVIGLILGESDQFQNVSVLVSSSNELRIAFIVLIVGIVVIATGYRFFSNWIKTQKIYYTRPHLSRFARVVILPFFGIILITSMNVYIQSFEVFDEIDEIDPENAVIIDPEGNVIIEEPVMSPAEIFSKILNTINILVIGYSVAQLIPIIITKREKSDLEDEDFEMWKDMRGFSDDDDDLFHKCFKWLPPKNTPEDISDEDFEKNLKTEEGRKFLEEFRTTRGQPIGSYEQLIDDPFKEWRESERKKYVDYYDRSISGDNQSGRKLKPGQKIEEIYPIDTWREEKRLGGFAVIIPGGRIPGTAAKKR